MYLSDASKADRFLRTHHSIRLTELWFNYERKLFESECERDRRALTRELEERRGELRESLIAELEDKRRLVEMEKASMEITGDSMDVSKNGGRLDVGTWWAGSAGEGCWLSVTAYGRAADFVDHCHVQHN